ncbi:hypothetical protein ACFX2K_017954 [Malus domestica]
MMSSRAAKQWWVGSRGRQMTARTAPTTVFSMHDNPSSFLLSFVCLFRLVLPFSSLIGSFSMHGSLRGEGERSSNKFRKPVRLVVWF